MADDVTKLLSEYIAEHRAGGKADPLEYVDRAGAERGELAELIDGYLARSPGREWDAEAYKGSAAERVADTFGRSLQGAGGWWPTMLPRLRHQAALTRGQVVERLSAMLGVPDRSDKVGGYYHEMEHGTLDSSRVSERVLAALGEIYGTTAEKLREIGEPLGEARPAAGGMPSPAMARKAFPDPDYAAQSILDDDRELARSAPGEPAQRDEIDELFTGGP